MNGFTTMRVLFATACCTLVLGIALTTAPPACAQDSDKLLAEVRAAWEKREAATKTIRMSWTFKNFTPKGGVTLILPRAMTRDGKTRPPTDVTHKGKASLLLDGLTARYTEEDMIWSEPAFAFTSSRTDCGFVDGKSTTLGYTGTQKWPGGIIKKTKWNAGCGELSTWAPCIAVRGTSNKVMNGDGLEAFTEARRAVVDGKRVIELIQPRKEHRGELKIWVLPEQDYSAIRYEVYEPDGQVMKRLTATMQRHRSGVWLPATWTSSSFHDKQLTYTTTSTMTSVEVGLPVTDNDFHVAFPVGTQVTDMTGDKSIEYIVKEDNKKRVILPSERIAKYDDLLRTETGELAPGGKPSWFARNWWVSVVGGVVLVLLAWLLYRMPRSQASSGSASS